MSDKDKNLNEAISQIEKQFGKGTVMKMGDREIVDIPSVSTGSLGLDIALGIGGLPKGRVVEIFGPESSGKTTLTLQAIAECQKAGGTAAFIDAEHALDPNYAEKLGVNVDELLLSQPDTGEQALEVTDMLVKIRKCRFDCCGFCSSFNAPCRDRRRYGRSSCGIAGKINVTSTEKNYRKYSKIKCHGYFYQSNQNEDWCYVR